MARISELEMSGLDELEISLTQAEYDAMMAADGTAGEIEYTIQQYDMVVSGGVGTFEENAPGSATSSITFDAGSTWIYDSDSEEWVTAAPFPGALILAQNFNPTSTGALTAGYDSLGLYSTVGGTDTPIQMMSISQDGVPASATIADGPMAGGSAAIEHYDWDSLAQPAGYNYLAFDQPTPTNPVWKLTGADFGTDSGLCFAAGTLIATEQGEKPVEDLCVGDKVLTRDDGYKAIKWIGCSRHSAAQLAKNPNRRPIRIKAGALGQDVPTTDLQVSPQHRVLVQSKIAERMFAQPEVLVAARALLPLAGVEVVDTNADVAYYHVMCDQHEVLMSNGAWTESLYAGKEALQSLSAAARQELHDLMPELIDFSSTNTPVAARLIIEGHQRRKLVDRHVQNDKSMTDQNMSIA